MFKIVAQFKKLDNLFQKYLTKEKKKRTDLYDFRFFCTLFINTCALFSAFKWIYLKVA